MPDTPDQADAAALLLAYADAQARLERLEERRRLSPVRTPLRIRTLIAERQALARLDHQTLAEEDIYVDGRHRVSTSEFDLSLGRHAIGAAIRLDVILRDAPALLEWLGIRASTEGSGLSSPRDRASMLAAVEAWQGAAAALPPAPPLLHGAHMARLWRQYSPIGRADLVASLLIGDRWGPGRWDGSAGGLIALGLEQSQAPWQRLDGDALDRMWLSAITSGAQSQLDLELRLRAYAARAAHAIAARRRPGRLRDVLRLAMAHPRISSNMVARSLDLTVAGAIKLLTIATEAGLLVERTGQASFRSYAIPVAAPSEAAPRTPADPFPTAEMLDDDRDTVWDSGSSF